MAKKNHYSIRSILAIAASTALTAPAWAGSGDVDLFSGGANLSPNVLLLIDNSASMDWDVDGNSCGWGCDSRRDIAVDAVKSLVDTVNEVDAMEPTGRKVKARMGLMEYKAQGGVLAEAIASASSDSVKTRLNTFTKLYGTPISASLLDAGRYFAGPIQWGTLPKWGTVTGEASPVDVMDLYCRKNFTIMVTDGEQYEDYIQRAGFWDTVGDSDEDLGSGEGHEEKSTTVDDGGQWADDVAHAMYNHDFRPDMKGTQNVITHTIGFTVDDPMLGRMAENGGGTYYQTNTASELSAALAKAMSEAFDDVAGFSATVVPTSRTLAGSAFYNAYFEPGAHAFWGGHLEAYRLTADGSVLDDNDTSPFDDTTGLMVETRSPYWDAGDELLTDTSRNIYTTLSGLRADFATGNTSITTTTLDLVDSDADYYPNHPTSGVTTAAELRAAIINYLHGQDAFSEDATAGATNLRGDVLGDIFHSTPRIVSRPTTLFMKEGGYAAFYNANKDRDRVIYAGANDGMLHAFAAGDHSTGDDPYTDDVTEPTGYEYYTMGDGEELFGYVPGLLLDTVAVIPRNTPRSHYYVDGNPVHAEAWLGDDTGTDLDKSADEWATVLITGFREGGPGYLALDVTDPDAGSYPDYLWEFDDAKLGQSWSEPIITRVKVKAAVNDGDNCGIDDVDDDCREVSVAIFGGGYTAAGDPNLASYEADPSDAAFAPSKSIYIVELKDGDLLARIDYSTHSDMKYSLPSTPAVIDINQDGFADVIYIGDLGGQVWKWDISAVGSDSNDADTLIDNWTAGVFFRADPADMGSGEYHYRSFFAPPAATYNRGALSLAFATGEREDLRYAGDSGKDDNNRFYVVSDRYPTGALAFKLANGDPRPVTTEGNLSNVTAIKIDDALDDSGFYFVAEEGEKFVSEPVIFAGYVLATAFKVDSTDQCSAANGESFLYSFRVRDAKGMYDDTDASVPDSRRKWVGEGMASAPRVSMANDPANDKVYVKTSKSKFVPEDPPDRDNAGASVIYWKQGY